MCLNLNSVTSKRTVLERAISEVERALKKSRQDCADPDAVYQEAILDRANLLASPGQGGRLLGSPHIPSGVRAQTTSPEHRRHSAWQTDGGDTEHTTAATPEIIQPPNVPTGVEDSHELAVENADNPLQLLAVASTLPDHSPSAMFSTPQGQQPVCNTDIAEEDLDSFFECMQPKREQTAESDPIEMGLVDEAEAKSLFE